MNSFFQKAVLASLLAAFLFLPGNGCSKAPPKRIQGYVEAEYVYVASQLPGPLQTLSVQRGDKVQAGDLLFALDCAPELALRDQAARMLSQATATWTDLTKAKRVPEIAAIEAQLKQAQAALTASETDFRRQEQLMASQATTQSTFDRAQAQYKQDQERVSQLKSDLEVARLPARPDQIDAAAATVRAQEAALAKADWDLAQKKQSAQEAGLIFDTLFRPGEWVPAGKPVVVLLPPENMKVRAFVPESQIGSIKPGQQARVFVDGVKEPFIGHVAFISPRAEYTPPVIYSQESRSKLVFMIELRFDPKVGAELHPGQPVDVELGP